VKKFFSIIIGMLLFMPMVLGADMISQSERGIIKISDSPSPFSTLFAISATPRYDIEKGQDINVDGYVQTTEYCSDTFWGVAIKRASDGEVYSYYLDYLGPTQSGYQFSFDYDIPTTSNFWSEGDYIIKTRFMCGSTVNNANWYGDEIGFDSVDVRLISQEHECEPNGIIGDKWCMDDDTLRKEVCYNYQWDVVNVNCDTDEKCVESYSTAACQYVGGGGTDPNCEWKYWYDGESTNCGYREFCEDDYYSGLYTFEYEQDCIDSLQDSFDEENDTEPDPEYQCTSTQDCEGLFHVDMPGFWSCVENECIWIIVDDPTEPYCGDGNCDSQMGETEATCPDDCIKDGEDINYVTLIILGVGITFVILIAYGLYRRGK